MADVTLKYKGATIGELSESGSKTLETAGKYCEADILLEYEKPQGGDGIQLPAEFQRVEYIGSRATDPNAWPTISVPITIEDPKRYVFKTTAQIREANTATKNVVGMYGGAEYFCAFFYSATQTNVGAWKNNITVSVTGISERNTKIITLRTIVNMVDGKLLTINEETAKSAFSSANTPAIGGNLLVFDSHNDTSKFYGDVYEVEVFHQDSSVVHLIPCYRKADNVIGMYDLVSETFYTSTTSGTFIKGADVN